MKKIIVLNHKMNLLYDDVIPYIMNLNMVETENNIIVCPSNIYLESFLNYCDWGIGSQSVSNDSSKNNTGKISALQLKSLGIEYVIVGHSAVFIAVGTGIGAGIIMDGHVLHGASDIIGATGWMALKPPYTKAYDECGCFEYYASGNGIGARARDAVRNDKLYRGKLRQKPISRITAHDVFQAYQENDPIAISVLNQAVEMWGMASANMVSLINPQKIIFGGGVFGPANVFIDDIYKEACKWAQPLAIKQVEFVPSQLSGNAGLIGAAYLVVKSLENGK